MINELDSVALVKDLPEYGLKAGDVGTVVLLHGNRGYEVEFMTLNGDTVAVATLEPQDVRPIGDREVAHARPL
jgi:hypothetical protein